MVLTRYLLLFGDLELYEEKQDEITYSVSVGEYIIRELSEDDLELFNPGLRKIQNEYQNHYKSAGFIPAKFFIGHTDPSVSSIAANILSEPYELSKMWKIQDSASGSEENILSELLPKILDNYKMRRVEILTHEADDKILEYQKSGNTEEILFWIKQKNAINAIRLRLNEKLHRTGVTK